MVLVSTTSQQVRSNWYQKLILEPPVASEMPIVVRLTLGNDEHQLNQFLRP